MNGRVCFIKAGQGKEIRAWFHQFGITSDDRQDYGNQTVGVAQETVAIVEYEDGSLGAESLRLVRFDAPALGLVAS